ncbi:MAG: histidine kinase [Verrucomicrobia bacterium]|nr:histidine kinase [Cytophagales bacterium]
MFAHRLRYLFVLLLAVYSFVNTLFINGFEVYKIILPAPYIILFFLLVIVLLWEGNRLIDTLISRIKFGNQVWRWLWQFGSSLLMTTIATGIIFYGFYQYFGNLVAEDINLATRLALTFAFRINLFLNVLNLIFTYLRQLRQAQLEAEEFRKISVQAQLQSLKNQVNPHFLFNNLNVLSTLILKDPEKAVEFIEQFAKVYRYVLQNQEKEVVALQTELEFIDAYMFLLRTRFNGSLNIHLHIDDTSKNSYIVPVALQMLLENAIKHNISSKNKPLTVEIFTENNQVVVKNNFQPKETKEASTQVGLKNIAKRYEHISDKPVEILETADFFTVKLPLLTMN